MFDCPPGGLRGPSACLDSSAEKVEKHAPAGSHGAAMKSLKIKLYIKQRKTKKARDSFWPLLLFAHFFRNATMSNYEKTVTTSEMHTGAFIQAAQSMRI